MKLSVNADDLLRFAQQLTRSPSRIKAAIARSLNQIAEGTVRELQQSLMRQTGLSLQVVSEMIKFKPATSRRLQCEIEVPPEPPASMLERGFRARSREELKARGGFQEGALVKVVTAGDDKVCPECQRISEEGPYSIEDARTLIPHHPHCRCELQPFSSRRRLPVTFAGMSGAQRVESAGDSVKMTVKQMARVVQENVKVVIRSTMR